MLTTINPPAVPAPRPTYSHVLTVPISPTTTLITIAGQIGIDAATGRAPAGFTEQVVCALANLRECLAAAGAAPKDIIKVTHYVVDLDPEDQSRGQKWVEFAGDHRPPSTLLGVAKLAMPGLLYEVDVLAVVGR